MLSIIAERYERRECMPKKLISILFLLAIAVALIVCMPEPGMGEPTEYSSPYFEGVSRNTVELKNEITLARLAVTNDDIAPQREKYFEPDIKAVLLDIRAVITPAKADDTDELIVVYIDGIDESKVHTFARCFPYNNYRFKDGTNYTPRYTKDVAAEISSAWRAVLEDNKTPDTKRYFKKDIKAVLQGITGIAHSAGAFDYTAPITVEMLELTQEKIEIFKKCFPYDYYVFDTGGYAEF